MIYCCIIKPALVPHVQNDWHQVTSTQQKPQETAQSIPDPFLVRGWGLGPKLIWCRIEHVAIMSIWDVQEVAGSEHRIRVPAGSNMLLISYGTHHFPIVATSWTSQIATCFIDRKVLEWQGSTYGCKCMLPFRKKQSHLWCVPGTSSCGKDEALLCKGQCEQWLHRTWARILPSHYNQLS